MALVFLYNEHEPKAEENRKKSNNSASNLHRCLAFPFPTLQMYTIRQNIYKYTCLFRAEKKFILIQF